MSHSPLTLVFATSNAHKTQEVAAMLADAGWRIEDLRAHPGIPPADETGETFEANAILKAAAVSSALPGVWVLADDSGLEVDALNGAPGVRSARYAGKNATDADNRAKLKEALTALPPDAANQPFTGRFRCCMALVRDQKVHTVAHGAIEGHLLFSEQGAGGFGYDSLFVPQGYQDSFGVLSAEIKNSLSHRAAALQQIRAWLAENVRHRDT